MAFAGRHDLPVYFLADPPRRTRHMLLSPAVRWRVIVEQVSEIEHDVILETVLRIRAAGEVSPTRIADLLQLPEDLVRHLLAQASAGGLRVTQDGQLQTSASKVAWVYRDIATGELWPDPAAEVPPLATRFTSRYRAQFNRGTPGRPNIVECLLLDTPETTAAEPTSIELARFSRASDDPNRRTAIVSSGEACLVASPVVGLTAGCVVQTTRGVPHLSLSQHLARAGQQYENVSRWLAGVPKATAAEGTELPLRRALSELRDVAGERTQAGDVRAGHDPEPRRALPGSASWTSSGTSTASTPRQTLARDLRLFSARGSGSRRTPQVSWRGPGAEPLASRSPVCWRRSRADQAMLHDLAAAAVQFTALAQATDHRQRWQDSWKQRSPCAIGS